MDALETTLHNGLAALLYCDRLSALNLAGVQISAEVSATSVQV
jgi:hypothetical protein